MCSTPFGIKDHFTPSVRMLADCDTGCSTPFGIKDHFTPRNTYKVNLGFTGCSTPFGIKDHFTRSSSCVLRTRTSAQRLSASKIISRC